MESGKYTRRRLFLCEIKSHLVHGFFQTKGIVDKDDFEKFKKNYNRVHDLLTTLDSRHGQ